MDKACKTFVIATISDEPGCCKCSCCPFSFWLPSELWCYTFTFTCFSLNFYLHCVVFSLKDQFLALLKSAAVAQKVSEAQVFAESVFNKLLYF